MIFPFLVEVLGFDHVETRQLLLGFGERAVGQGHLAVAHPDGSGGVDRLQRLSGDKMAAAAQFLGKSEAGAVRTGMQLVLGKVDKAQIVHDGLQ
jgi:hypothetical protein